MVTLNKELKMTNKTFTTITDKLSDVHGGASAMQGVVNTAPGTLQPVNCRPASELLAASSAGQSPAFQASPAYQAMKSALGNALTCVPTGDAVKQ
jgi:hypothetical protein